MSDKYLLCFIRSKLTDGLLYFRMLSHRKVLNMSNAKPVWNSIHVRVTYNPMDIFRWPIFIIGHKLLSIYGTYVVITWGSCRKADGSVYLPTGCGDKLIFIFKIWSGAIWTTLFNINFQ